MKVNVFKIELLIIDFDECGEEETRYMIENARYPNRCITPEVKKFECREIEWIDEHPLNLTEKCDEEYNKLFKEKK